MAELFAELSGVRIVEGRIVVPRGGAWHADVTLDKEATIAASGLVLVLGNLRMVCAPWRAPVAYGGKLRVRLVGGAGGWGRELEHKPYRSSAGVRLSLVLGDAARTVGERVELADDRVLGPFYIRAREPACRLLNRLVPGAWRIDPDGVTRTGERPSTEIASPLSLLGFDGARGVATVATEFPGDFVPGRTFRAITLDSPVRIGGVTHSITKGAIRTEVLAA